MAKNRKKHAQQIHFRKACIKRVGQILDDQVLVKSIQNQELEFIDRQSNRITRWKYSHNNNDFMIIYDKDRKQVVTIIPYKDGLEESGNNYFWWLD